MQTLSIGKKKRIYALAFSSDGQDLAVPCGDRLLRIWNLNTGEVDRTAPIEETSCGYDLLYLDQNRIVFAGTDLRWWDLSADKWHIITPGYPWRRRIGISPSGDHMAEVDSSRDTMAHDGSGLLVRATLDWQLSDPLEAAENTTSSLAFSHDGRLLATGHWAIAGEKTRHAAGIGFIVDDYDYLVHLREFPSGRVVKTLNGWQQPVTHLAFTPDGSVLAGTAGPRLRIWDLASNSEIALHKRGTKHFQGLSFAQDGRFLATVSNDETVRIWDTRTWQEHTTFTWQIGRLLNIAFAPDGLRAAAGSDKGQIVIWDVE